MLWAFKSMALRTLCVFYVKVITNPFISSSFNIFVVIYCENPDYF